MRNIFDQYKQPENRLTHAVATALGNDRRLLHRFLVQIARCKTPIPKHPKIVEQRLPGDPPLEELEAERRGLPDVWIHDDGEWSLLIECKVASSVTRNQLDRHLRTAERRGFGNGKYSPEINGVRVKSDHCPDFCKLDPTPLVAIPAPPASGSPSEA